MSKFTKRQKQIVDLVLDGKCNKEIAVALGIRLQSVKNHITNIARLIHLPGRPRHKIIRDAWEEKEGE